MSPGVATLEAMSTRLFPKNQGADRYAVTGIAARCDWVVLSDMRAPHAVLARRRDGPPRHVFLSLRSPFDALAFFFDHVLPQIDRPFVLVSGSEDVTVPNQRDARWRPFTAQEGHRLRALADDPRLLHWFVENLDEAWHPKLKPLPVGWVFADSGQSHSVPVPVVAPLRDRPLRVLCAHRLREGPQWETRRAVTRLCRERFSDFCTVIEDELPQPEFFRLLGEHAFVICAEGGGLDPSPKAWHALLHGAIPIVRSTPLDSAYRRLPVAIVDGWHETSLSLAGLLQWRDQHAASFDSPAGRAGVLARLGIDYWWAGIAARCRP